MPGLELFGYYIAEIDLVRFYSLAYFILSIIGVYLYGRLLHEPTHWFVAWLLGAENIDVEINPVYGGQIEYELPAGEPNWKLFAINLSPQLVGLFIGFPYLAWLVIQGADVRLQFLAVVFLIAYSVLGGAADILPTVSVGDGRLWNPVQGEQLLVLSLGLLVMAFIGSNIDLLGQYRITAALGLAFAALGVGGMGLKEIKEAEL